MSGTPSPVSASAAHDAAAPAKAAPVSPPPIPDVELLRPVGRGGFGEVWLGVNRATGALRAVKVIPLRGIAADPAGREIVSLAQLESQRGTRHPHLLDIQHVGLTADHLFYLMDPADDVSGAAATTSPDYRPATLARRLEQGPLSSDECLRCARQLLSGLAHLHHAGMVHRDIKPANCLFVGRELKLADFGLLTSASTQLSRIGTVKYMPPDGRMDLRADVYAAGLVLYEMLTGMPAEAFPQLGDRAREIASNPVLSHLNRVALAAAQRDHHRRYAHAGMMLEALERAPTNVRLRGVRRAVGAAAILVSTVAAIALGTTAYLGFNERNVTDTPRNASATPDSEKQASERRGSPTETSPTQGSGTSETAPPTIGAPSQPPRVSVNFVTDTFEANIFIDGQLLVDAAGQPLRTPCTALSLPAQPHRVRFQHAERGQFDAGEIDFREVREVVAKW